jgi:hypothetical protein
VIVGRKTSVTPFTYAFVVRANEELYRRDACAMFLGNIEATLIAKRTLLCCACDFNGLQN